jgi:hypothetical protein
MFAASSKRAFSSHLGLDQGQQVVGGLLVALGVRVPRHPEERAVLDHRTGKEQIEIAHHHGLERNEDELLLDLEEARHTGAHRHLDTSDEGNLAGRLRIANQQVQREIRNERERMRGVRGLGRHQGEDVLVVAVAQGLLVVGVQLVVARNPDPGVAAELGQQPLVQRLLPLLDAANLLVALRDLLRGRATGDRQRLHTGPQLLFEPADALHDELVEIGADDRLELHAL